MISSVDTETALEAWFTGLNTMAWDVMPIKFKYTLQVVAGGDPFRIAECMHIVLHADHAVELTETGVTFFVNFRLMIVVMCFAIS